MKTYTNFELKNASWVKIGGLTKEFIEVETTDELKSIVSRFIKDGKAFDLIGLGANSLISDRGLDCAVIKVKTNQIEILGSGIAGKSLKNESFGEEHVFNEGRHSSDDLEGTFRGIDFKDLDTDESNAEDVQVKLDAGLSLQPVMMHLISNGITGFQCFSGIPGTIGASVVNNIHGGPKLLSSFLEEVEIITQIGEHKILRKEELEVGYNKTRFQNSGDVILSATFNLKLGDKERAKFVVAEWAKRKRTQPKKSLGSVFHNLEPEVQLQLGFPTPSIGFLVEHKLNLSGFRCGDALIFPKSNNFIVNCGNASATEYLNVMKKIYDCTLEMYGIELKTEIFLKGFEDEEIKEFSKKK